MDANLDPDLDTILSLGRRSFLTVIAPNILDICTDVKMLILALTETLATRTSEEIICLDGFRVLCDYFLIPETEK